MHKGFVWVDVVIPKVYRAHRRICSQLLAALPSLRLLNSLKHAGPRNIVWHRIMVVFTIFFFHSLFQKRRQLSVCAYRLRFSLASPNTAHFLAFFLSLVSLWWKGHTTSNRTELLEKIVSRHLSSTSSQCSRKIPEFSLDQISKYAFWEALFSKL